MADSAQLLRAKAMLLIRREREVHEYRQERSRIELWLKVFHKLSLNLRAKDTDSLLEQWVRAMVGELNFQVAAVYACDDSIVQLRLLAGLGQVPLARQLPWSETARRYLDQNVSGFFSNPAPEQLGELAEGIGLGRFYFLLIPVRGQRLLLTAGFARGSERFHTVTTHDHSHFDLLGSHLCALLDNAALIAELDREKSELQSSNYQLDVNVQRLSEAQQELLESARRLAEVSRRAGMADIATGVLHNVGNALNSVNVSAEVMAGRVRNLRVVPMMQLAALLNEQSTNLAEFFTGDQRGRHLPGYLHEFGKHLVEERDGMLREIASLQEHVEHIKAIVSGQQRYATSFDMSQPCVVTELLDDAIALCEHSLAKHGIVLVREYECVADVVLDRHKVLQILVNLLKNAKDALLESDQPLKRIVARIVPGAAGFVRIELCDNGVGLASEELPKLFRYGFTTKRGGHGFGLHTSAVAAEELGGTLGVSSEGRGQGATFALELPLRADLRSAG